MEFFTGTGRCRRGTQGKHAFEIRVNLQPIGLGLTQPVLDDVAVHIHNAGSQLFVIVAFLEGIFGILQLKRRVVIPSDPQYTAAREIPSGKL